MTHSLTDRGNCWEMLSHLKKGDETPSQLGCVLHFVSFPLWNLDFHTFYAPYWELSFPLTFLFRFWKPEASSQRRGQCWCPGGGCSSYQPEKWPSDPQTLRHWDEKVWIKHYQHILFLWLNFSQLSTNVGNLDAERFWPKVINVTNSHKFVLSQTRLAPRDSHRVHYISGDQTHGSAILSVVYTSF